jgi:hypothetical protein
VRGYYTLTRNGLQLGMAVTETKVWKDKDLNQAPSDISGPPWKAEPERA